MLQRVENHGIEICCGRRRSRFFGADDAQVHVLLGAHEPEREQIRSSGGAMLNRQHQRVLPVAEGERRVHPGKEIDRKSTRLNSSHVSISYAVFCLKKKKKIYQLLAQFDYETHAHTADAL